MVSDLKTQKRSAVVSPRHPFNAEQLTFDLAVLAGPDPRPEVSTSEEPAESAPAQPASPDQFTQSAGHGEPHVSTITTLTMDSGEAGNNTSELIGHALSKAADQSAECDTRDDRSNYVITAQDRLGVGSAKEKCQDNLAAIRLLKQIESEDRWATPAEQAILVRYVGWGGLPQAFDSAGQISDGGNHRWLETRWELKDLLTEEEYGSARSSVNNAHYTSETVIRAIWDGVSHLGFTGGRVLEPAAGIGHFIGLMPAEMAAQSNWLAVEIDSLSGRIARQLYQRCEIRMEGFEKTYCPDDHCDLVVGNVPFGNYPVADPRYDKHAFPIHDYFLAKCVDRVRPGGLGVLITSHFSLDKQGTKLRRYVSDRVDLVGAIRLPQNAFLKNALTEVTTDILILQKRMPGARDGGEQWLHVGSIKGKHGDWVPVNEYYERHPEMLLGDLTLRRGQYGREEVALVADGRDLGEALREAIHRLPAGIFITSAALRQVRQSQATILAPGHVKQHAYTVQDGQLYRREGDQLIPVNLPATTANRIPGMIRLRDAAREVLGLQLAGASDAAVAHSQFQLNAAYVQFTRRYGFINARANVRAYAGDPDLPFVLSLEHWDADQQIATKADIFSQRTIQVQKPVERVETAQEALLVSLNELGRVDWPRMSVLTGKPSEDLQDELKGLVFRNPETDRWEIAEVYLSGNVRQKLRAAEAAAATRPEFQENVEALKAVQPADLQPGEIAVRLGAPWIPTTDVEDFLNLHLLGTENAVTVTYIRAAAVWTLEVQNRSAEGSVANTEIWGTKRMPLLDLMQAALRQQVPTVRDYVPDLDRYVVNQEETLAAREKLEKVQQEFKRWLWSDQERAQRLARKYNDTFNAYRLPRYNGSHLTLPGIATCARGQHLTLRRHQKDAIWRILTSGNTLLAHVVGSGKTWVMVAAAMELRRLGLARKPMVVVPNHLVEQWGAEWLQLYPGANVLVATKEDFEARRRRLLFSRIATGDWDAVVVAHSSFEKIRLSQGYVREFFQRQVDELEHAIWMAKQEGGCQPTVKELEKAKKRLLARMEQRLAAHRKDDLLTFEELGIDYLLVDEAHEFKNLYFFSRMPRIAGLPNSDAQKSWDIWLKTQYVTDLHGGRGGVVFATGTPISNTMAELFTMQRYLQLDALREQDIFAFDMWAALFGEAVTALEVAPDGSGFRMNTRFARFVNIPELMQLFRQVADVQTADMLDLPVPQLVGGKPQVVSQPATPLLREYVEALVERAEKVRNREVPPEVDNMLKICTDGRKAALDLRLIDPATSMDSEGKVNRLVEIALNVWRETQGLRGTQLIFSDLGTPGGNGQFNVYDLIRDKLIAGGVPTHEVVFIHQAVTDVQKDELFKRVRQGKVRFLLGSTAKCGAGMNVQTRLVALHHLDAPWRPSDIEQREGRILRQGNLLYEQGQIEGVCIYRYVTAGSFDAYMWQCLETKARFIAQVMSGQDSVRHADDIEGAVLTYAEVKALASGNPLVMQKVYVDTEVRKLSVLRRQWEQSQWERQYEIAALPGRIAAKRADFEAFRADLATRQDTRGELFRLTIDDRTYRERKEAGSAVIAAMLTVIGAGPRSDMGMIGEFAGFGLGVTRIWGEPHLMLQGSKQYSTEAKGRTEMGIIAALEHLPTTIASQVDRAEQHITNLEKRLADLQEQVRVPWEHEERFQELVRQQEELNRQLDLDRPEPSALASGGTGSPEAAD